MIRDDIKFVGVRDFYKRCDYIRSIYSLLKSEDKMVYKYYLYSKRHIREYTCDIMWEFLNEEFDGDFIRIRDRLYEETYKYRI